MLTIKQILLRSARLFTYLTLFNLMVGIILNILFSGDISLTSVTGHIGNLSLVEAALFFLLGGATDFIHTAKWSQSKKYLNLGDRGYTIPVSTDKTRWIGLERPKVKKPPDRGGAEWTIRESKEAERKALVYVLVGIFLCLELVFLVLIMK